MLRGFGSDNHASVHPEILKALVEADSSHTPAYGTDIWSKKLQDLCCEVFGDSVQAFPVFNGTAANVLCLASLMNSFEAVLCSEHSHLHLDECGAPEKHIGGKLRTLPSLDGKVRLKDLEAAMLRQGDQHYSQNRVVSLTQPTELGTLYSLDELLVIGEFCRKHQMFFHIDGARFIYAPHYLNCSFKNLTQDIGLDALSFGGTKNGLLFGELCLLFNSQAQKPFKFLRKQFMQLPSKQKYLALQFLRLLDPARPLWQDIAIHGHQMALYLAEQLSQRVPEVKITQKVQANSVFATIPKSWVSTLRKTHFFYVWNEVTFEARLMMSFDSTKSDIDQFIQTMQELRQ